MQPIYSDFNIVQPVDVIQQEEEEDKKNQDIIDKDDSDNIINDAVDDEGNPLDKPKEETEEPPVGVTPPTEEPSKPEGDKSEMEQEVEEDNTFTPGVTIE